MTQRYEQLDSLRGLAAVAVIFSHYMLLFNPPFSGLKPELAFLITRTPLFIWGGREAVLFFFILSGFVLSIPFINKTNLPYNKFIIRRIFRIYIPYIVSLVVAILLREYSPKDEINTLSGWFNTAIWATPFDYLTIIKHILLVPTFDPKVFNGVVWSLVHEMRIAIIFPFLMLFIIKFNWKLNIILFLVISIIGTRLAMGAGLQPQVNYYLTIHFLGIFIFGSLIAKHRLKLISLVPTNKFYYFLLSMLGLLLYTYRYWFLPNQTQIHYIDVNDWLTCFGVAIFIILSLKSSIFSMILTKKPLIITGQISFSLYLYHMPIVFFIVHILYGILPMWSILTISFVCTYCVSLLSKWYVENPSIYLGKLFTTGRSRKTEKTYLANNKGNEI